MHRFMSSLMRCGNRIKNCVTLCIRDILSTVKGYYCDKRLGGIDTSYSFNDSFTQGLHEDSLVYSPTGYGTIQKVIDYLKLNKDDVFIDFGCGKGRVIFAVGTQRLKKVIGVELDKRLTDIAKANLSKLKFNNTPIEILNINAIDFDPKEGTIFFMFNPFEYKTMEDVLNNIKNSLISHHRKIRIVYHNPRFKSILDRKDWLVAGGEIGNTGILVWHNQ